MRALLALFIRSLKEDVRGKSTYIVRGALVTLVLFFLWMTHIQSKWSGAVGREFFETVTWIDLFVLSVVGLTYFASAITEEKENETLGLLRMTNLDALSILLGKSTSRMIGALFILAAQLPFMFVAVTMGGLAVKQVFAGFACLAAYAFLLANAGLMCSVLTRKTSNATVLSGVLILVLLVFPWWLSSSSAMMTGTAWDAALIAWARATPFVRINEVVLTGFSDMVVGWQFAASLGAGVVFFLIGWLIFERFADPTESKPALGLMAPAENEMTPTQALAGRARTPALRWKDYHYVAGGDTAVVLKAVAVVLIIVLCTSSMRSGPANRFAIFAWTTTIFTGLFLLFCLALDASRVFKREREQRTLSSLMTLPLSSRRIVREKTIGCLKASWPPIAGFLIGILCLLEVLWRELKRQTLQGHSMVDSDTFYVVFAAAHGAFAALLLPVFIAWLSLRMRWGAFPVGGTIWFIGNWIVGALFVVMFEEGAAILLPFVSFFLLCGFWLRIPGRLEELAAEE